MFSSDFWPPRVVTGGVTTISVGVILPSATVILTVDGSLSAEFHSSSWRREAKYTMFCHNRRRQWFRLWGVIDPAPQWTWIIPQPAGTAHHACFLHDQPFSCTHRKTKGPNRNLLRMDAVEELFSSTACSGKSCMNQTSSIKTPVKTVCSHSRRLTYWRFVMSRGVPWEHERWPSTFLCYTPDCGWNRIDAPAVTHVPAVYSSPNHSLIPTLNHHVNRVR